MKTGMVPSFAVGADAGAGDTATELLRSSILYTRGDAFRDADALVFHEDGGLLIEDGRVAACGEFSAVRAGRPDAVVRDWRGGYLLPGFVDVHVHYPQLRVTGGLEGELLDWLQRRALPEEARMADGAHAARIANGFVDALAAHGTTTAMVFGSHFAGATGELFESAGRKGLRVASGLVLSDRSLLPELHQTAETCYRDSKALIARYHGQGRLLYAVTPRFALSASEAVLEVCQTLMREHGGVRFQTHLNENAREVAEVRQLFPWAGDYYGVYEHYGLAGRRAVMAHNVHPGEGELERMAGAGTAVAHCPCSNLALGSGMFPMAAHLRAGVHCALGTDVGGGTGFGMMKEALQAYLVQRVAPEGLVLTPGQMLYLATLAGAEAMGLGEVTGSFAAGKWADVVYLRAREGSALAFSLEEADTGGEILGALFAQAGVEAVREVRVAGAVVWRGGE